MYTDRLKYVSYDEIPVVTCCRLRGAGFAILSEVSSSPIVEPIVILKLLSDRIRTPKSKLLKPIPFYIEPELTITSGSSSSSYNKSNLFIFIIPPPLYANKIVSFIYSKITIPPNNLSGSRTTNKHIDHPLPGITCTLAHTEN